MSRSRAAPRLYCIPAGQAPVVAVFRRGPSNWSHVGLWDIDRGRYQPGAWLKGRIFPRRSDVSPDGRFLCCYVHKPNATWEYGDSYVAVSRLPWLEALYAFGTCGTWTRGYHFDDPAASGRPEAHAESIPWGLSPFPIEQFAAERRRGWLEAPDCPPRRHRDMWDMHRNARMYKTQPGGEHLLYVECLGRPGGEFGIRQSVDGMLVQYAIETDGDIELLEDLQWADWDRQGRLLAATREGRIQIRRPTSGGFEIVFDQDLSALKPDPVPAPA